MERIEEAYRRFASAFENRDLSAIADMLCDDFAWTLVTGDTLDREAALREIGAFLADAQGTLSFSVLLVHVAQDGEALLVNAKEEVWAGETADAGDGRTLLSQETVLERWVPDCGKWKLSRTVVEFSAEV